jgi:mRNA interferase MazF
MGVVRDLEIQRGDVFLINLDPSQGSEIRKTRPCIIVSPDELNEHLETFIVAPLTTGGHLYPFRLACRFEGKAGFVVLDQIRTVDRGRLVRRLGKLPSDVLGRVLETLQEMFAL